MLIRKNMKAEFKTVKLKVHRKKFIMMHLQKEKLLRAEGLRRSQREADGRLLNSDIRRN